MLCLSCFSIIAIFLIFCIAYRKFISMLQMAVEYSYTVSSKAGNCGYASVRQKQDSVN